MISLTKKCLFLALIVLLSCHKEEQPEQLGPDSFGYALDRVNEVDKSILLSEGDAQILVSPAFQGRVLTSTSKGLGGRSYGWLNYQAIEQSKEKGVKKSFGGEDRLWLAPLGSKYSLYYGQNEIAQENWQVPALTDTVSFNSISRTQRSATFKKRATVANNIGTAFDIDIYREIRLFTKKEIVEELGIKLAHTVSFVGFQSQSTIKNIGEDWDQSKGLIAPWSLGMFPGNSGSIAIFPFTTAPDDSLKVEKYLAELDQDRLKVVDSVVCFKTDGSFRSKIGLKSKYTVPAIGNYDAINNVLTIVTFSFDSSAKFLSCTETSEPVLFDGDVVNSYNNSANEGQPTFFELESAAPGRVLKTGESISHTHNTFHFEGPIEELDLISKKILKCSLLNLTF